MKKATAPDVPIEGLKKKQKKICSRPKSGRYEAGGWLGYRTGQVFGVTRKIRKAGESLHISPSDPLGAVSRLETAWILGSERQSNASGS